MCAGLLYLMMAWGDKHWKSDIGGAPWRKCSMQHPAPWCFLAHSLATLGRWGCGEHYLHTQTNTTRHIERRNKTEELLRKKQPKTCISDYGSFDVVEHIHKSA